VSDSNTKNRHSGEIAETEERKHSIDLSTNSILDTTGLNDEDRKHLQIKANEAKINLQKKAQEANIDIQATKVNLDNLNDTVKASTLDGTSITVTHTQSTSIGRTEIVMGNTERAASGKISRSGAGLDDISTTLIVGVGIIAIIIVLIMVIGGA